MEKKNSGVFGWYFNTNLLLRILIGLILGSIVGLAVGPPITGISFLGTILVRLLKMIVMPIIICSLVVGAASLNPAKLGRVGFKILLFYFITSALAVTIGLIFANVINPGAGMELASVGEAAGKEVQAPPLGTTLLNIIPTNPFGTISSGAVLPVIFFSLIFGIGISFLLHSESEKAQQQGQVLLNLFEGGAEIMYMVVRSILQYAPIGVFALIAVVFGTQGSSAFGPLLKVTLTVYLALFVHLILVYGSSIVGARLNIGRFFRGIREAAITAFVTRSSSGSLPVTMTAAEEKLGVPRSISSFTLPLGATINMDGTAIYQGVCAVFIATAVGASLTIGQQATIVLTAVLASIGTAGVPGAGAIMLLLVLNSVGLPVVENSPVALAYALILGIDALLDMGRTGLNVCGDLCGTTIVAKSEKELNLDKWKKAPTS